MNGPKEPPLDDDTREDHWKHCATWTGAEQCDCPDLDSDMADVAAEMKADLERGN